MSSSEGVLSSGDVDEEMNVVTQPQLNADGVAVAQQPRPRTEAIEPMPQLFFNKRD